MDYLEYIKQRYGDPSKINLLMNSSLEQIVAYSYRLTKHLCHKAFCLIAQHPFVDGNKCLTYEYDVYNEANVKTIIQTCFFHLWYRIYNENSEDVTIYNVSSQNIKIFERNQREFDIDIYHRIMDNINSGKINSYEKLNEAITTECNESILNQMPKVPLKIDTNVRKPNTRFETDKGFCINKTQSESLRLLYGKGENKKYNDLAYLIKIIIADKLEDHTRYVTPNKFNDALIALEDYYQDLLGRKDIGIFEKSVYFYELEYNWRFETYFNLWELLSSSGFSNEQITRLSSISSLMHMFFVNDKLMVNYMFPNEGELNQFVKEENYSKTIVSILTKTYWCTALHEIVYHILKKQGIPRILTTDIEKSNLLERFCNNIFLCNGGHVSKNKILLFNDELNKKKNHKAIIYPSDLYRRLLSINYQGFTQEDLILIDGFTNMFETSFDYNIKTFDFVNVINTQAAKDLLNLSFDDLFA